MGAHEGNQYHLALKDPEIRQRAYKQFCAHLAKGKAVKSWYFVEGDNMCTWQTLLTYIKDNPKEFNPIHKEVALAQGYQIWEAVCEASACGDNEKANTASLQMIMRNKFGWDKKEENSLSQDQIQALDKLSSLISRNPVKE